MNAGFAKLRDLDVQVQAMSRTESPAEVFKVLREACRLAAPRGALFLVRQGRFQGWSSFGYSTEAIQTQKAYGSGLNEGFLGEVLATTAQPLVLRGSGDSDPDFGQPVADEAVGSVVRIQGKPIAVVLIERNGEEQPWHPEAVGMLTTVAQLRLELDLAIRKLKGRPAPPATSGATPPVAPRAGETPPKPAPKVAVAPKVAAATAPAESRAPAAAASPAAPKAASAVATAVSTEVAVAPAAAPPEAKPELQAARRYARLVATDIRLYNEEAVALGRRNGDLARRLEEHMGRGKETFLKRHAALGNEGLQVLHQAYVEVLAAGDDALIPAETVVG